MSTLGRRLRTLTLIAIIVVLVLSLIYILMQNPAVLQAVESGIRDMAGQVRSLANGG